MKFLHSLKSSAKRLDARGISHIIVPLAIIVVVAVGGTYAVVASHADSLARKTGGTAAKSTKKTVPPKSYIVVYSERGAYDTIKIHALNPSGKLSCGGTVSSSDVSKSLPKSASGLKLSCSPTTGNEAYYVYFGKNKQISSHYVAISVSSGSCTLVHYTASLIRQVPAKGSTCVGANTEPDVPTKQGVNLTVSPKLSSNKKTIQGTISLTGTDQGLTRVECAGQVSLQHGDKATGRILGTRNFPLRFVSQGKGLCQAKISNLQGIEQGHTYMLNAWFTGNAYLNSAQSPAVYISIPAAPAKKTTPKTQPAKPLH